MGFTAFKVKVTVMVQNVSECLSRDFLNHRTVCYVTKFGMVMQHHEPESFGKFVVVAIFKVTVTARAHMIKI